MSVSLHRTLAAAAVAAVLSSFGAGAQATVINLEAAGVAGHGIEFCGAGNAASLTLTAGGYDVVLSGGLALGPHIAFLPATSSVAYGTADFANACNSQSGYTNPLTIEFFAAGTNNPLDVKNFFVDLYNGNSVPIEYSISDNLGHGGSALIGNNTSSGQKTFGIAAAGHTITITGGAAPQGACCQWDFFIDNIGFNERLPDGSQIGGSAPEPGSVALAGLALAGLGLARRRRASA